ncbi:MAG: hypothetical protein H7Y18_02690, partial [Clostridiaceae bacterium]|nr:hypothetical protein [Clostridiaceae bacterium]
EILTSNSKDSWEIFDCTPDFSETSQGHKIIMPNANLKGVKGMDIETKTVKKSNNKIPMINISYFFILCLLSLALFLGVIGVVFIRVRRWRRNKNKILFCQGVIPLYYYSKKRLTTVGIKWSNTSSDEEGALGLKDEILREHFINIVKVFYEEYYGGTIDPSFDKLEFYKYLEGYIKKSSGFFKYYYNKFFSIR